MQDSLPEKLKGVGLVVIGRNEGERFRACLASLPAGLPAVYVDSGSTDNSVANAEAAEVQVAHLSNEYGFTAARARNLGWRTLLKSFPNLHYVQFIDGDCSLDSSWLGEALAAINQDDRLAIVFGRRRERYPEQSFYNGQCDREWNVPVGEVLSCGGDAFMRVTALFEVDGYNDQLIAGEEPDLCLRMRALGWRIRRITPDMTMHDAAILTFGGWWKRAKRAGHAYAEHVSIHGGAAIPDWARALASMLVWGIIFPGVLIFGVILGFVLTRVWFLLSLAVGVIYVLQFLRLSRQSRALGLSMHASHAEAFFLIVAKFAHCAGAATFLFNSVRGKSPVLMEYK
jgi:glycosyltransferase involved in cell wall biosynthesis